MTERIGRPMDMRLRVQGWLRTEAPLHVGGIALDPSEVLPVAVDGQSRIYVPGTALAGAFRAWMRGAGSDDDLRELWGFSLDGDSEEGHASRIVVRDALITASTDLDPEGLPADPIDPALLTPRHGVGIDRTTGAVASELLYARTVVPAAVYVRLELDVESTIADYPRDRARLHALLNALLDAAIPLGAATRNGLGVVRLLPAPDLMIHEHSFTAPDGLLALLRGQAPTVSLDALAGDDPELPDRPERLTVRIDWTPAAPVMVRSGEDGASIGALPLTTRRGDDSLALVLTGKSVKGALRGHAEFIERTVRGQDACKVPVGGSAREHSIAFRAQLDELPAIKSLFGTVRTDPHEEEPFAWGAGALTVQECVSRTEIPARLWDELTYGSTERGTEDRPVLPVQVREELAALGLEQADHVAIDRWTGGAADGRLFSVLEPHEVDWQPLSLSVDLTRLGPYREIAVALLMLVLRDLAQGRVPLGGMVTRGFGDITVTSITLTGPWMSLEEALGDPDVKAAWTGYLEDKA